MVLTKGEHKIQDSSIRIRCTKEFSQGVRRAAIKAKAPSVSEWIKATLIEAGEKIRVKIPR